MAIRNSLEWTISTDGRLGLLQLVSELGTERCANVKSRREMDYNENVKSRREVDYEIPYRLETRIKHSL